MKKGKKTSKASIINSIDTPFAVVDSGNDDDFNIARSKIKASSRRNFVTTNQISDKFKNIEDGLTPFYPGKANDTYSVSAKDSIRLCQKAYYNFPVFRNTIELMVEFSASDIYFRGGSAKGKQFFEAFFKKINLKSLQDKFFREYYRSGNVFLYRHDIKVASEDIKKITQVFGGLDNVDSSKMLPIKYLILNPADVEFVSGYSFTIGRYSKILNEHEVNALRYPKTEEDKEYFNSLPSDVKDQINQGAKDVLIYLDPSHMYSVFYKKQDYEPFSVPMGYGVLSDINYKEELKKMDIAIARTIQQVVLLVTNGAPPDQGGINPKNIQALQKIFENQSVGRVLVADHTTKAQFVIPQISDILDPKKYEIVDKDIMIGLHNILVGDDKFANQSLKIQLFVEKLKHARQCFLDEFLFPEIKRLSQMLGFKNYPIPYFEEFDLKDEVEFARIYSRLAELGILTPEETITAIEKGVLPDPESSIESQKKLKELRKQELYMPLSVLGKNGDGAVAGQAGRPAGTTRKQSTKKVSPIGASINVSKLLEVIKNSNDLEKRVQAKLLEKHSLEKLNEKQIEIASIISKNIIANENVVDWEDSIDSYINNTHEIKEDKKQIIAQIVDETDLSEYESILLMKANE